MVSDYDLNKPLGGTPSDDAPDILATGRSGISTLFVSMAERHPEGADAGYLRWHTLDHRPEQQRLASIGTSLRVVSTPECRRARAASDPRFDDVDHVMTYFFTGEEGLEEFGALSDALRDAGRAPFILPPVQRGVYDVGDCIVAPHTVIGADVLPWLPVKGTYILVEEGGTDASLDGLLVPGVAGVWSATSVPTPFSTAGEGQRITLCFLDENPIATAARLAPVLEQRWKSAETIPLLAAPFHAIVPYEWDKYLP